MVVRRFSDALVAKSSKACKNESKLIAKFRTNPKPMLATITLPQHSEIIEVAVAGIVEVAITTTYYQMIDEIGLGVALEWPTLIDVNDDLGFVYPGTVLEESKCDPNGFCRFFTETTIYVLESADPDWVDKFEEKLLKTNSNSKANVNFEVNFSKEVSRDTVELVEY